MRTLGQDSTESIFANFIAQSFYSFSRDDPGAYGHIGLVFTAGNRFLFTE
jgi:hypothetical protein